MGFGTAGSTTTMSDEDSGTTAGVGLVVEIPTTGTEVGGGAVGVEV